MQYKTIKFEIRESGAWITFNRPNDMNSLSREMFDQLDKVLMQCKTDDNIRVVVITGSGRAFCTGADLKDLQKSLIEAKPGEKNLLDRFDHSFRFIRDLPKPVIAALNGFTLAGGLELAMCCDIILAAESAKLGDAHSNFGVFPGAGGAAILPRKIGINRAKYLLFTGDFFPAAEFERFGLVNRVVPDENLLEEADSLVKKLSDKSPLVLRKMKEVANATFDQSHEDALNHETVCAQKHLRSYDLQEGLKAFAEKRKPEFKGY